MLSVRIQKTEAVKLKRGFLVVSKHYYRRTFELQLKNAVQIEINGNIVRNTARIEIPNESLYNLLMRRFAKYNNRTAFINGITGEKHSYKHVADLICCFGGALRKSGFGQQGVMGLLSRNCPEYFSVVLATIGCRGIVTTMNSGYTTDEIVYQLKDSGATSLTVEGEFLEKAMKAADIVGLQKVFVIGDTSVHDSGVVTWHDVLKEDPALFPRQVEAKGDEIALLPYSSGTTGKPKGVMLTHHNIVSNLMQCRPLREVIGGTVLLGLLPFFHIYGFVVIGCLGMIEGYRIVTLPSFQPDTLLHAVEKYEVQILNLVPPLWIFLLSDARVDQYDLSSLVEVSSGAAPCAVNLYERMSTKFKNVYLIQGYGMTEASPVVTCQTPNSLKPGSTGVPLPNTEVKVVNAESGEALGPNQCGEIYIRGPQVMRGYFERPDETSWCITEDGWLRSGDIGYYDGDGDFFVVDRLKELIKYKGFQVPPAELEDLLLSHDCVSEAVVIGIPTEDGGEIPRAYVVKKKAVTAEELILFVENNVARHKRLRGGVEFVDSIPKSASGKLLRRLLRDKVLQHQ